MLGLRHLRLLAQERDTKRQSEAQALAVALFEGVVGWAFAESVPSLHYAKDGSIALTLPQMRRGVASECLKVHLPIIPFSIGEELAHALDSLEAGIIEPMVLAAKDGPRGRDPLADQSLIEQAKSIGRAEAAGEDLSERMVELAQTLGARRLISKEAAADWRLAAEQQSKVAA